MLFKRFLYISCVASLLLAACQQQTAVPTPDLSSGGGKPIYEDTWSDSFKAEIEWEDCTFDAYQAEPQCGYLSVPQDYGQPDNGETLRLALAVYKTRSTEPKADPLILVIGMPMTGESGFLPYIFEELYQERDLVIFDLRGTGMTGPELICPELSAAAWEALPTGGLSTEDWSNAYEACRQTLETLSPNLDIFSLANMANDLKALRLALGYTEWNLFAVEPLGAYVAYEQLHIDPEGVRSLVLDSVAPVYSEEAPDFSAAQTVLTEIFTGCAQHEKCNSMFPDLEKTFYDVVDQLNAKPVTVKAHDNNSGRITEVQVNGNYLVGIFLNGAASGQTEMVGQFPRLIYQIRQENYEVLRTITGDHLTNSANNVYDGLYAMTLCNRSPYPDESAVNRALSPLPLGLVGYFEQSTQADRAACEVWAIIPPALPVTSGSNFAPMLLINGGWNWQWGAKGDVAKLQKAAPDAQVVTLPMSGQFNFFTRNVMTCTQQMFNAFIEDPEAQVDASCVPPQRDITWITLK